MLIAMRLRTIFRRLIAGMFFVCAAAAPVGAKEIVVQPSAADRADMPIATAIRGATEGDTLRITKGIYPETIVIDKRLTIVGEPGAILDPSQPFVAKWQAAPEI